MVIWYTFSSDYRISLCICRYIYILYTGEFWLAIESDISIDKWLVHYKYTVLLVIKTDTINNCNVIGCRSPMFKLDAKKIQNLNQVADNST